MMKNFLKTFLIVVLCLISLYPIDSFAIGGEEIQWYEADFTDDEFERILDLNTQNNASERVSGLINSYNVAIAKNGSYIDMAARVVCDSDVVKCGFKKIVIQKRATTSSAWVNCLTFENLYDDSFAHAVGKTFSVPSGYQYRVVCTFYAKRSLLVTQKIEHASNVVTL